MKKFTDEEKLQLIFKYFKEKQAAYLRGEHNSKGNIINVTHEIFDFVIDLFEYNRFPQVEKDEDYKNFASKEYYRGVKNIDHHGNILVDYNYHRGIGIFGNGIYSTPDLHKATLYTKRNPHNLLTFKFSGKIAYPRDDTNYTDYICGRIKKGNFKFQSHDEEEKIDTLKKFYDSLSNTAEKEDFKNVFFYRDPSIFKIFLGYDALYSQDNLIVFNRKKMLISQSEYDRICEASTYYKNGIIDFEKKIQDNYQFE